MTLPFDKPLYDAVMEEHKSYIRPGPFETQYESGYKCAAQVAARIAAERQPVPVSDEELLSAFFGGYKGYLGCEHCEHDNPSDSRRDATLAGIRAAIAAAREGEG